MKRRRSIDSISDALDAPLRQEEQVMEEYAFEEEEGHVSLTAKDVNEREGSEGENGIAEQEENQDDKNRVLSAEMAANIQQIQQKMELFTQKVSGLLEAGKNFFDEISNQFEERLCMMHQEQMNKWQEEIQWLREMDTANEDVNNRIHDAQYLLHAVQTGSFGSANDKLELSEEN